MARSSRARGGRGGGGASKRQTKATSRKAKAAPVADVEVVEETKGIGIDDGVPVVAFLLLLTAIIMIDYVWGTQYAGGVFFK